MFAILCLLLNSRILNPAADAPIWTTSTKLFGSFSSKKFFIQTLADDIYGVLYSVNIWR